jgi:tyrosine-specific transport protein
MSFLSRFAPQTVSAIFLVAGTCIGGGMLALPVASAINGFIPSTVMMLFAYISMTLTALYLVEVGFWMKKDEAHLISMTGQFLGKWGKLIAWLLYLFICYASLVAYTAGAGHLMAKTFDLTKEQGCLLFTVLFGPILFCSHVLLGRLNALLFIAMIIAYVVLIGISIPHIQPELLAREEWHGCWLAVPLLLTAFSFQTMVPSLHPYLNHDAKSLKVAIIGGTTLALIVYLVWQATVLGSVPLDGDLSLMQALKEGEAATHVLGANVQNALIGPLASAFAFFALVTSFLGISLGLFDFLSDGLGIPKKKWGTLVLGALIIVPTYYSSINFERVFLNALDASGGFGDAMLNGIMPILMIALGRYHHKLQKTSFAAPKSTWLLYGAFLFYFCALGIEVLVRLGHLTPIHSLD